MLHVVSHACRSLFYLNPEGAGERGGAKSGSCWGRGLRKRWLCAQEEAAMHGPVRATSLQEACSVNVHSEDAGGHSQSLMGTTALRAPSHCPVFPTLMPDLTRLLLPPPAGAPRHQSPGSLCSVFPSHCCSHK